MASIQLPPEASNEVQRIQRELTPYQQFKWAKDLAEIFGLATLPEIPIAELAFQLGKVIFEIADPKIRREVVSFVSQLQGYVSTLTGIFDELVAKVLSVPGAIVELIADGFSYIGQETQQDLEDALEQATEEGVTDMAAFPVLTPSACTTGNPRHKGVCCQAYTQLGATVAQTGFQYQSCPTQQNPGGKTICMKCLLGTSTSTNPKRQGKPIFIPRRVSCGPAGCPVLGQGGTQLVI